MAKQRGRGIALVALSAAAYGFMPLFARVGYASGSSTHTFLFLRFLAASLIMLAIVRAKGLRLPSTKMAIRPFLLGIVGYFGQSLCYFTALRFASASTVALLLYTYPALVMIGSAVLFGERNTRTKLLSLVLALTGSFIIVGTGFSAEPLGMTLAILTSAIYAGYVLVSSRIATEGSAVQSALLIMLGTTTSYAIMNLVLGFVPPQDASGWVSIALVATVSTVVAFWAFLAGMEHTGPTTAALVSTLEPVVSVFASVAFLAEPLTLGTAVGGCLVIAALLVTAWPGKE